MHEVSIAQSLLDTALSAAAEHDARRIGVLHLRIGGLRQVVEESLLQAFDLLSEGTIAEGAEIRIDWVPTVWRCSACGRTWDLYSGDGVCSCGSEDRKLEGSDDLTLTSLDLECDDED